MADDAKVFLSYSSEEIPFVRAVAEELERRGVDAWLDQARLGPGASFHEAFDESLESAKLFIVFVSEKTLQSSWANFEIGAAVGREKPVLPVFLTEAARLQAPSVIAHRSGIAAYHLKPDEVAEQIVSVVEAA
jgi:hypothetical protein